MFGRKKTLNERSAEEALHPVREGAKNRPTPKRRDQEAARKQPLIVTDRKQAKSAARAQRGEQMALRRQAMMTGDDRYLPERDKGPRRRFIRDFIDARRNLAEFMLPIMVIVLAMSFVRTQAVLLAVTLGTYGIILISFIDGFLMWRRLKARLTEKFGGPVKGDAMYAIMRTFQMRRTRMPKVQVARGQYPS
ncbi:MAG: DUF3043 domain-containing protein [Tetrasphaera sp.]|nr:DUF3043 domain-containing protein [Tetrasphaera sp.]